MYSFLPLGQRVINEMESIIDEHLESVGAQKIQMPILQNIKRWEDSGRRSLMDKELFCLKDRKGQEYCLSPTNEEVITSLTKELVIVLCLVHSSQFLLIIPLCYIKHLKNSVMNEESKQVFYEAKNS